MAGTTGVEGSAAFHSATAAFSFSIMTSGGYCPKYTPYTVRRMYGLRKADLRALEAAGLVKSEGKVETYEVHLDFGRGNRALRHQYREYYWTTKEQK